MSAYPDRDIISIRHTDKAYRATINFVTDIVLIMVQ